MKQLFLITSSFLLISILGAQSTREYIDISGGIGAYFLPVKNFNFHQSQSTYMGGWGQEFSKNSNLGISLLLGYSRNKFQGDAIYIQALLQYAPVIAGHLQPGIAIGTGYQKSFYPGSSVYWDGQDWRAGKKGKGVIQVPLKFSLGYQGISLSKDRSLTPYLAYQVNTLFRYSPDLTPLPASNLLLGIKYYHHKIQPSQ